MFITHAFMHLRSFVVPSNNVWWEVGQLGIGGELGE